MSAWASQLIQLAHHVDTASLRGTRPVPILLISSSIILLCIPVLAGALTMIVTDRNFDTTFFDAREPGRSRRFFLIWILHCARQNSLVYDKHRMVQKPGTGSSDDPTLYHLS